MRRVAVTGLGAVCAIGNTAEDVWKNASAGVCGIRPITHYDPSEQEVKIAGEVRDFDPVVYVGKREPRRLDLSNQYGIAAAVQAMEDSGLDQLDEPRDRWGVIISSGIGGIGTIEREKLRGIEKGYDRVATTFIPMAISNMTAGHVAIRYGLKGMCSCVVTACASSANGIGDAFRQIRDGYADVMVAGGTEAAVTQLSIGGFTSMRALTSCPDPERASIPFDAERNGFVMGEGAGVLILEEYEHAVKRGAHIYAELKGYAANCDAHHITAPSPDGSGAEACMRLALQDAGITPGEVDYINAHGTSTKLNDAAESAAIRRVFAGDPMRVHVSSTKSMTGHLLGAAAAVEAVITVRAMEQQVLPPQIHYRNPDPECSLNFVLDEGKPARIRYAMSDSLGFGGHNAVLVFGRAQAAG